MGWSIGYDSNWKRDIGYGVPASCDHPGCEKKIDRGLAYICGSEPYGGEKGCGLYFCEDHLSNKGFCRACSRRDPAFNPTRDLPEWIEHKMMHPSWAAWRAENGQAEPTEDAVKAYLEKIREAELEISE